MNTVNKFEYKKTMKFIACKKLMKFVVVIISKIGFIVKKSNKMFLQFITHTI